MNWTYDAAGNVLTRVVGTGTQTLRWDSFGRLAAVQQRDASNNGFDWKAVYDGLGRRIQTTHVPVQGGSPLNPQLSTINSYYDPQIEFQEVGVAVNGARTWKTYGPDLNGVYGGLQGTGGLEAIVEESSGTAKGAINDAFGNIVAMVSGTTATWTSPAVGGYGLMPGSTAQSLDDSHPLIEATVWRGHYADPSGFYYLGARYYDPASGRFLSPDPLGHAASISLYDYAGGDPVNSLDPDGRFGKSVVNGFKGISSSSIPSTSTNNFGSSIGGIAAGFGGGLNAGLQNFNNTVTLGLYDRMGWSNSAANTGWEHDLSRSFATIPRDVALGAGVSAAYQNVARFTASAISAVTNTAVSSSRLAPLMTRVPGPAVSVNVEPTSSFISLPARSADTIASGLRISPYRLTQPGETFIRYESAQSAYSHITPSGVTPSTFAAPISDGLVPLEGRIGTYNLPLPEVPRPNVFMLQPPPGSSIIGPRSVVGGTGNEVLFPYGY